MVQTFWFISILPLSLQSWSNWSKHFVLLNFLQMREKNILCSKIFSSTYKPKRKNGSKSYLYYIKGILRKIRFLYSKSTEGFQLLALQQKRWEVFYSNQFGKWKIKGDWNAFILRLIKEIFIDVVLCIFDRACSLL